jgi:iron(III) transport system ATP-binding protein
MTTALTIRALSKTFRIGGADTHAVESVDLSVPAGSFLTLLGPSGCGKSTTLRMIAGLEQPDDGEIIGRDGHPLYQATRGIDVPARDRGVGMVFQSLALWPHLTVAENVAYPLRMMRRTRREMTARVEDLLRLVELEGLGGRRPGTLSGGQQQRVAIARALAGDPDLLLLDEPFSALDSHLRHELGRALRDIQRTLGMTVIYVTHDRQEALRLSDEVAIMHAGRLIQSGAPSDVYRHPRSPVAARLLGDANILAGVVVSVDTNGSLVVDSELGQLVATDPNGISSVGSAVEICIRPEHLRLRLAPLSSADRVKVGTMDRETVEATGERNLWQGSISRIEYRGPWLFVEVKLGQRTLALRCPSDESPEVDASVVVLSLSRNCVVMRELSSPEVSVSEA